MSTGWLREEEARADAAAGSASMPHTAWRNLKKKEEEGVGVDSTFGQEPL